MQKTEAAAANASAMTAAATDTHCSTRTRSAGGQQQSFSQHGAVPDSSVQRILAQMLQTAEAAEQIKRQRDALALSSHAPQQQSQNSLASASLALEQLLSSQSVGPDQLQQQLHDLASLLSLPAMPAGTHLHSIAAAGAADGTAAAAAVLGQAHVQQEQGQQHHDDASAGPAPTKQLQHMCSMADSSKQEATAVDALLDLEFAARDAGSFTENRAQIAAALARAIAGERQQQQAIAAEVAPADQQEQAAGAAAHVAIKLEAPASPQAAKAAAAGVALRRRSSSGPCPSAPVAAAATHPSAACAAAASAPAAPGSDRTRAHLQQNLQQELWSLLSQLSQVSAQDAPSSASLQLGTRAAALGAGAGLGATAQSAAVATGVSPLPAVPPFTSSRPIPGSAAGLLEDIPILPVVLKIKQELGLQQQANRADAAAAINPAAAAAAAGLGPMRSETSGFLERLLQQSRQLQSPSGGNSAGPEQQQALERPGALLCSTSNLTSSTVVPAFGLNSAGAAAAAANMDAGRMQQLVLPQPHAPAAAEGPYNSYLDANLLALYAEFKTTRKQVLAIVREAVDQGVMNSTVVRRLHQLQQSRQKVTDSPSFTPGGTTATAAPSGNAVPAPSTGTQPSGGLSLGKRSRNQQVGDAAAAGDTAAADADAPSSKLRRTEDDKAVDTAAAEATAGVDKPVAEATAGAGPGAEAGDAAEAQAGADAMDTSAPNDSAAQADSAKANSMPADIDKAERAGGATGAATAPADAQAAATAAAPAAAAEDAQTTPTAAAAATAVADPPVPAAGEGAAAAATAAAGEQSLLSRSVEALVLIHSLTNRALSKAVSAKKEGAEALNRADLLETMTAVSNSNTQHLQLQCQMLQQQLHLAQLQLQAKQQQLQQIQARSQHTTVAYPQLVSRVAKSVTRLVATAYREHLPVAERQELAMIAEELLNSCQHH